MKAKRICYRLILLIYICFYTASLFGQEEIIEPPARSLTSFRFTLLSGGIVIVKATLDDFKDSLNFVLDTGSGGISLDSSVCVFYNLLKVNSERVVRGIAGMRYVQFTNDHTLHLPGLTVRDLDFHINDYDILTTAYGMPIHGIIGFSFLRRYIVKLDYDEMMIEVMHPGFIKYPRGGHLMNPQFTTLPMYPAVIKDGKESMAKYYLDTGAGLCILLNSEYVKDSSILQKKRKIFKTQAEGLGGKKDMLLTLLKEVKVGPYRFRTVPAYIFDDDFNVTSYPILGGLIGNDILRRFNMIINYPQQQIHIKPNKHFVDSFDYSYTGLGFYDLNGRITVTDIVSGSPAELAGFKEGDIILAMDNNFSNSILSYKNLLQTPRKRIKVIVSRNGTLEELDLVVKSILGK
jgi:hypothetical protein